MVSGLVKEWRKMKLPRMVKVKQKFARPTENNVAEAIKQQFIDLKLAGRMKPGANIAVGVGSRGIGSILEATKTVIEILKESGFNPFIIPTMGSHGGATSQGQRQVIEDYGITEQAMGVPIISSLDVEEVGKVKIPSLPGEFPVYVDKVAMEADGIVVINRVKPHTLFRGEVESGLMKMLTIGLGKHQGASMVHSQGYDYFHELIPAVGEKILEKAPIFFGVGIVENAFEETAEIKVTPPEDFIETDKQLLLKARELMGKIKIPEIDVLLLKEIGKEISGDGMDPNVVGRFLNPALKGDLQVQKVVIFDLSEKTEGNANGTGLADVITKRLFDKIDFYKTYVNAYTATVLHAVKIPMVIDTDEEAIQVAASACLRVQSDNLKIVYIKNTLHLTEFWVSEHLVNLLQNDPQFEVTEEVEEFKFDDKGNLLNFC